MLSALRPSPLVMAAVLGTSAVILSTAALLFGPLALSTITPLPTGAVGGLVSVPGSTVAPGSAVEPTPATEGELPAAAPPLQVPDPIGERSVAARVPADPATLSGYIWPLPGSRLTQPFGPTRWGSRVVDGEPFHDGIDLATFCGDRVVAAHDGTVLAAGRRYDEYIGWVGDLTAYTARLDEKGLWNSLPIVVVIDDGNDYRSMYAHFRKVVVKPGQIVKAGELLGYEGDTGRASGCHLHYGLFTPFETRTFGIREDVVGRMKIPERELARINPLIVLPSLESAGIR